MTRIMKLRGVLQWDQAVEQRMGGLCFTLLHFGEQESDQSQGAIVRRHHISGCCCFEVHTCLFEGRGDEYEEASSSLQMIVDKWSKHPSGVYVHTCMVE